MRTLCSALVHYGNCSFQKYDGNSAVILIHLMNLNRTHLCGDNMAILHVSMTFMSWKRVKLGRLLRVDSAFPQTKNI